MGYKSTRVWSSRLYEYITVAKVQGHDPSTASHPGTPPVSFNGAKHCCWALISSLCSAFSPGRPWCLHHCATTTDFSNSESEHSCTFTSEKLLIFQSALSFLLLQNVMDTRKAFLYFSLLHIYYSEMSKPSGLVIIYHYRCSLGHVAVCQVLLLL